MHKRRGQSQCSTFQNSKTVQRKCSYLESVQAVYCYYIQQHGFNESYYMKNRKPQGKKERIFPGHSFCTKFTQNQHTWLSG